MCRHVKFIRNRYDGRSYLVNCGHCPACLQEKSNRHISRINLEAKNGRLPVFVTLSYENDYIPYLLLTEVLRFMSNPLNEVIPVYRSNKVIQEYGFEDFKSLDGTLDMDWDLNLKFLRYKRNDGSFGTINDHVGVLFLRDLQLFIKRLKINLVRAGYTGYFSYYYASEYGEKYNRPHFHLLFFIDKEFYSQFRFALDKSWYYADLLRLRKQYDGVYRCAVEIAKNPARYVSSYLNCSSYVPSFLSTCKPFKPFRRFSLHFGCHLSQFSLPSLLSKIYQGNLRYSREISINGVSTISFLKIPKFVLSQYFIKFKGYRYLSSSEIIHYICRPSGIFFNRKLVEAYSDEDLNDIYIKLCSIYKRGLSYGNLFNDWLYAYPLALSLFSSESLKDSFKDVRFPVDLFYHYDNIADYYYGDIQNYFLSDFSIPDNPILDPADFPNRLAQTQINESLYLNLTKHHKIKSSFYEKPTF